MQLARETGHPALLGDNEKPSREAVRDEFIDIIASHLGRRAGDSSTGAGDRLIQVLDRDGVISPPCPQSHHWIHTHLACLGS